MEDSYLDSLPEIQKILHEVSDDNKLIYFGCATPTEEVFFDLQNKIDAIVSRGHDLSLIMIDIAKRSGVSYCSEKIMCYQSTIKAIYIGSLLDERPELFLKHQEEIRKTIEISDNDTYAYLRDTYGNKPLIRWCRECGLNDKFACEYYPRNSCAKQLCILWSRMYAFLESGRAPVELKEYLSCSACSSARDVLSDRCFIQTKAGWENGLPDNALYYENTSYPSYLTDKDPGNDECAINDSGIVFTSNGPYLFVVFSDIPYGVFSNNAPANPLNTITESLYQVKQSLR